MRNYRQIIRFGAPAMLVVAMAACTGEAVVGEADEEEADETTEAAAAPAPAPQAAAPAPAPEPVCADCGTISSIEPVDVQGQASGAGAVSGAVAGVVVGNQIGRGRGKTIAKIIGGIGGAVAGHKAEQKIRSSTIHRVGINMDAGGTRVLEVDDASGLHVGQKVSVYGNTIALR